MIYLDTETYSETPITNGTFNYGADAEVMLVSYAFDDGEVQLWDRTLDKRWPAELYARLTAGEPVVIHNSFFDRTVMRLSNLIELKPEQIIDTMVQALSHGLPGGLDKLGAIFGLGEGEAKMKEGRQLIHFFCKPYRGQRNTRETHPERWAVFCDYAKRDIVSMRAVFKKMPRWNYPGLHFLDGEPSNEHYLWCLDQRINDRGFAVDLDLAVAATQAAEIERKYLNKRTAEMTDGDVTAATQRDAMLRHILKAFDVELPDMRADTLQRRVEDERLPIALRQLLDLRIQSSRNSSAKYKAVISNTSADNRLHGSLQFCGAASTGRWSGRTFQPQNLMRPSMDHKDIERAILDIKAGSINFAYDNVQEVLGNCVRGIVIAPSGKKLVIADLASIEGRGLAWLAGEDPVVQFYRDVDAGLIQYDAYMLAYASVFGGDPETVTKPQRTVGKPIELAFGYGGGVAAFLTFAMTYHLDLPRLAELVWEHGDPARLRDCEGKYKWAKEHGYHAGMPQRRYAAFEYVKQKWREARPETVMLWDLLAKGFMLATLNPGKVFDAGPAKFRRDGDWLRMRLPSGRCLVFLKPQVTGTDLSFLGLDRYTRKWSRQFTHGGKLSGLLTQAFASDVLRDKLPLLEERGYEVVLTVHDEGITETPDSPEFTAQEMVEIMTSPCAFAPGLPLAAEGFETYRYRKE